MALKIITAALILLIIWLGLFLYPNHPPAGGEQNLTQKTILAKINNPDSGIRGGALPAVNEISQGSVFLTASQAPNFPLRNFNIAEPEINTEAAIAFDINSKKILYQKNASQRRPIASLTKLMTALVVLENIEPESETTVSKNAVEAYGKMGNLVVNERITIKALLYALLMESSNDAAVALAEAIDPNFVALMNKRASSLGMQDSYFADPSGLNPKNISTAQDLVQLTQEIIKYPLIIEILQTPSVDLVSADGQYNHHLVNTNRLLQKISGIIGGKTGYLEEAGECLFLVAERPKGSGDIIYIILGAAVGQKFFEMEKLITWTNRAYVW